MHADSGVWFLHSSLHSFLFYFDSWLVDVFSLGFIYARVLDALFYFDCFLCVSSHFKMQTPSQMLCSHTCTNFSLIDRILAAATAVVGDERHPAAGPGAAPLACTCRHKNLFIIKVICFLKNLFSFIYFLGMNRILIAGNCSSANSTGEQIH